MTNPIYVDVAFKIQNGEYQNTIPFPELPGNPSKPVIFYMLAGDMTPANIESLVVAQEQYKVELDAFENANKERIVKLELHFRENQRLEFLFKQHCEASCFGVASGERVERQKLAVWGMAYKHGHEEGFTGIWYWYQDFAEVSNTF